MITRRHFIGAAAGAGVLVVAGHTPATAAPSTTPASPGTWEGDISANGWRIDPAAVSGHRVEGSNATLALHGSAAVVLLHVARRWHYEIAPLDTGEGGGATGHTEDRRVAADFESNHLSGSAVALHPTAYPIRGSEGLWPHQEAIVRDILADCEGVVTWGGDLTPAKVSHFHIEVRPESRALRQVVRRLDTTRFRDSQTASPGAVRDPAEAGRRERARRLERAQKH